MDMYKIGFSTKIRNVEKYNNICNTNTHRVCKRQNFPGSYFRPKIVRMDLFIIVWNCMELSKKKEPTFQKSFKSPGTKILHL